MSEIMDINKTVHSIRLHCTDLWLQQINWQDKLRWETLYSSCDTVEDTQYAINQYQTLPDFNAHSGGYLFVYGLLQALYVQMDAVKDLYEIFKGEVIIWNKFESLNKIRQMRNDIEHPTNRRGNKRSYINQNSLNKQSFQYMKTKTIQGKIDTKFFDVDISDSIQVQNQEIGCLLSDIEKHLSQMIEEHRAQFKGQKLETLTIELKCTIDQWKNSENECNPKVSFQKICDKLDTVQNEISKRYGSIIACDTCKGLFHEIDSIKNSLIHFLDDEESFNNPRRTGLTSNLVEKIDFLNEIAIEIDEKYAV